MSGGGEGQVRVWDITKQGMTSMKEAMKEHKGKITCIKITASDEEVRLAFRIEKSQQASNEVLEI